MNGKRIGLRIFFGISLLIHASAAFVFHILNVNSSRNILPREMLFVELNQAALPDAVRHRTRSGEAELPKITPGQAVKEVITTPSQTLPTVHSPPTPVVAKLDAAAQLENSLALKTVPVSTPLRLAAPATSQGVSAAKSVVSPEPSFVAAVSGTPGGEVQFGSATGPAFQERVLPTYPPIARKFGKEGKVVLRLSINEQGNMTGVEVLADPGYGFANAAVEALKKSSFAPARIAGRSVPVKAILPIRFTLQGVN